MHHERKNLRSTSKLDLHEIEHVRHPKQDSNAACKQFFSLRFWPIQSKVRCIQTRQEKFPVRLHKGNQYIFVAYIYDANAILIRTMPNQEAATQVKMF